MLSIQGLQDLFSAFVERKHFKVTCAIQVFRSKVTHELCLMDEFFREQLRGDFLFFIDERPKFVLVLNSRSAFSGMFDGGQVATMESFNDTALWDSKLDLRLDDVLAAARAKIYTDEQTLNRLLAGTLKAKTAFVSGRVRVEGDLPGFLKLVGALKRRGITQPGA